MTVTPPPPVVDTFTEPNDAPAAGSAVAVDAGLTLGAPAGAAYKSATLQITGNLASAEDVLALTANPATMGNISASYDAATGTLTLTSAGNTATPAQWTAALDAVSYYDTSARPQTTDRSVTLTTTDTANTVVTAPLATIHVIPTNNSPILDTSIPVSLAPGGNDAQPPSGAVGTLVSSLIGNASAGASPGNVTDPDGAGAANGGAIIPTGLAVTGADTSKGNWYYSIDGGATWVEFAGTGIATPISDSNALHLLPTARLYFQATSTDFGGAIPAALTFRAWDQFDGAANGSLGSLTSPGFGALGAGANTSGSAYSSAADVVPLTVNRPPPVRPILSPNGPDLTQPKPIIDQPLIPQIDLVGSIGDRFIIEQQSATIILPQDLFVDTDPSQNLSYEVSAPGGGPLPGWLTFNPRDLSFSGTPPEGSHGSIEVQIVARDTTGHQAVATFRILVGRYDPDGDALLYRPIKPLPTHDQPVVPVSQHGVKPTASHPKPRHPGEYPSRAESAPAGRKGFTEELREAGRMGRLAQARTLLKSLN